jgi:hypothetical protein
VQGARAVQRSVIQSFPNADISVAIVWIDMVEGDSEAMAHQSARIMEDPRVRHFHDPERRAGKAIAQSLGGRGKIAWDIYLFFSKSSEWMKDPPAPIEWMHQLSADWADPTRLRVRDYLLEELRKTMKRLTVVA